MLIKFYASNDVTRRRQNRYQCCGKWLHDGWTHLLTDIGVLETMAPFWLTSNTVQTFDS
ncbi:uncharacterized protein BKA55DRAFT_585651 [Fusarium redolens]|uniref:Uncharacterized protein n=1 Tax=Fusarium redolens TaxID=48865 RepID=A0A9P9JKP3_FUSRE|nr:uncharacterized protein BKA55DRAFT_585651 [Fusarium redolens]KAH7210821.1 hypothetical protein BKA55DRAFT_585651 [Fusarium redolens]